MDVCVCVQEKGKKKICLAKGNINYKYKKNRG